jgi:hypothetical protein
VYEARDIVEKGKKRFERGKKTMFLFKNEIGD